MPGFIERVHREVQTLKHTKKRASWTDYKQDPVSQKECGVFYFVLFEQIKYGIVKWYPIFVLQLFIDGVNKMHKVFNIYCDESCHLEHDRQPVMLLGSIWCPREEIRRNTEDIRDLKNRHKARGELKWTKVSTSRELFFMDIVKFFFTTTNLKFRCLVVNDKAKLDHTFYNQGSHDSFYYKMYYYLLRNIISEKDQYNIYLDIKDTRSQVKIDNLRNVLCNNLCDFKHQVILRIQHVRSKEVELLQLADFLMGAIAYKNRNLETSKTKMAVIDAMCKFSGRSLQTSTPPWEEKFNLFFFTPRETC